jgi:surfeit locus 1 family protein
MEGTAGVHVLASLFPASGAPVVIDEGFLKLPQTTESASQTAVFDKKITGIVRIPGGQGWFEPDNDAGKNEWFWIDLPRMDSIFGIKTIVPVYIEATDPIELDGPIPTGQSLLANIPNQHLNYAITWFSLAGVLLVIYVVWIGRAIQARHGEH